MKHANYLVIVAIVLGTTAGLTGCKKTTGGGALTGLLYGGKITLGFQMRCKNVAGSGHITGQFQYNDHTNDVAFHGLIDKPLQAITQAQELELETCEDVDTILADSGISGALFGWVDLIQPGSGQLGTYTPQPKNLGEGGELGVLVVIENTNVELDCPTGTKGLIVQLSGGVYDGYLEGGCLDHGNFTIFEE